MLGKCDRLRKELSRAYATSLRNAGYIQRLADEINIIERAIATSECETQLSANVAALDDEAVDRMRVRNFRRRSAFCCVLVCVR